MNKEEKNILIKRNKLINAILPDDLLEFAIPENVNIIKYGAIRSYSLLKLFIPSSVIEIGESDEEFLGSKYDLYCHSLTDVIVDKNNPKFSDKDGILYNKEKTVLYWCPPRKKGDLVIDNSVIAIEDWAFDDVELNSVTIPKTVSEINYLTSSYSHRPVIFCESLFKPKNWNESWNENCPVYWNTTVKDVITQDGIQYLVKDGEAIVINYIGDNDIVKIPGNLQVDGIKYNVTSIGDSAFYNCEFIDEIEIPLNIKNIGKDVFAKCYDLIINCEISSKPITWNNDWNCNCRVYWNSTLKNTITQDGIQYLIKDSEAIVIKYVGDDTKIEIPSSIEANNIKYDVIGIGERAFKLKNSLNSIILSDNIKSINGKTFSDENEFIKLLFDMSIGLSYSTKIFVKNNSNKSEFVITVKQIEKKINELKRLDKKVKQDKKKEKLEKIKQFSYNYTINKINDKTYEIKNGKQMVTINVLTSFNDDNYYFQMVDLLYALKRKKDGTFSSGRVNTYKEEEFYEFINFKKLDEYPNFIPFNDLDEMQNYLDKCTARTNKKSILISMPTLSFECIEISKLKFDDIVSIANDVFLERKYMGFYIANSIIYAFNYSKE